MAELKLDKKLNIKYNPGFDSARQESLVLADNYAAEYGSIQYRVMRWLKIY